MQLSLCSERDYEPGSRASDRGRRNIDWAKLLPPDWREQVIVPVEFDVFREYEMAAERTTGRDENGLPCYCAHLYVLHELRSDDDEDYYQAVVYGESLSAWRLRDERWLCYRITGGEGGAGRGFFTLGDENPVRGVGFAHYGGA